MSESSHVVMPTHYCTICKRKLRNPDLVWMSEGNTVHCVGFLMRRLGEMYKLHCGYDRVCCILNTFAVCKWNLVLVVKIHYFYLFISLPFFSFVSH